MDTPRKRQPFLRFTKNEAISKENKGSGKKEKDLPCDLGKSTSLRNDSISYPGGGGPFS